MTRIDFALIATSAAIAIAMVAAIPAHAANECQVGYGYKSGSATHYGTVNLNAGQTKSINRSGVRYVVNKKNAPVKIRVTRINGIPPFAQASGTKYVTLPNRNRRDPMIGNYFDSPSTRLYTVHCQASSASSASANPASVIRPLIARINATLAPHAAVKAAVAAMPIPPHVLARGASAIRTFQNDKTAFLRLHDSVSRGARHYVGTLGRTAAKAVISAADKDTIRRLGNRLRRQMDQERRLLAKIMGAKNQVVGAVMKMMNATFQAQRKVMAAATS